MYLLHGTQINISAPTQKEIAQTKAPFIIAPGLCPSVHHKHYAFHTHVDNLDQSESEICYSQVWRTNVVTPFETHRFKH